MRYFDKFIIYKYEFKIIINLKICTWYIDLITLWIYEYKFEILKI